MHAHVFIAAISRLMFYLMLTLHPPPIPVTHAHTVMHPYTRACMHAPPSPPLPLPNSFTNSHPQARMALTARAWGMSFKEAQAARARNGGPAGGGTDAAMLAGANQFLKDQGYYG